MRTQRPAVTRDYNLTGLTAGRTFHHALRMYVLPIGCGGAWPGLFNMLTVRVAHALPLTVCRWSLRFEPLALVIYRWLVGATSRFRAP